MIYTKWFQSYITKKIKYIIQNISLPNENLIDLITYYRQIQGENNELDWKTQLTEQFIGQINLENLIYKLEDSVQITQPKRMKKGKKLISRNQKQNPVNQISQYLSLKSLVQCNGFPVNSPYDENQKNVIQKNGQISEPQQKFFEKQFRNSEQQLTDDMMQQKTFSQIKIEFCDKCHQIKEPSELLKINQYHCCSQCCNDSLNPLTKILRKLKFFRYVTESDNIKQQNIIQNNQTLKMMSNQRQDVFKFHKKE